MDRMNIDSWYVKKAVTRLGADLCNIALIDRFKDAPEGFHPQDVFPGCKSVIVLASQFARSTLSAQSNVPYTFVRNMMVNKMDGISFELANQLDAKGIAAVPIPSAEPYEYWDEARRHGRGVISLKHAGMLAGLGRIGKNTLLINDLYGNMIWLSAVLISEEVDADPLATYESCLPDCELCLDACPQGALNGVTIDQSLCRKTVRSSPGGGWYLGCNTCRKICPHHSGIK